MTKGAKETHSPIRMTKALKAQVRKYQKRRARETGYKISLSAAIRDLLEKGLEVVS